VSSNIEYALITRVIQDHDFHTLEKMGITSDFFSVPEMKSMYEYLRMVYHAPDTQGLVPSLSMLNQHFQSFVPAFAPDPVPILATHLRQQKLRMDLQTLAHTLLQEADLDPFSALGKLKVATQSMAALAESSQDIAMAGAFKALIDRYTLVSSLKGIVGVPYPWDVINDETQGMQGGQFIVLYGRPKSMKTWLALYMAVHAYMNSRRRVLFYTREMAPLQIAQRAASAICKVSYSQFKNGTLQPDMFEYVKSVLQGLVDDESTAAKQGHQPCFIISADRSSGGGGVAWLQAKIRELKPDIVFVDGMYLMKDDRSGSRTIDWKNIAHISQDLKLTAQEFDIPVVGITQANRGAEKSKGEDLTELAYADSLGQDADAVFRVRRIVKNDESTGGIKKTELHITAPGLREGVLDGIVIHGNPATDFSYIRNITAADMGDEPTYAKPQTVRPGGATFSKKEFLHIDPKIKI
jgi:replicative DNA helicase